MPGLNRWLAEFAVVQPPHLIVYVRAYFRVKVDITLLAVELGQVNFLGLYCCLGLVFQFQAGEDDTLFAGARCLVQSRRLRRRFLQEELLLKIFLTGIAAQKWIKPVVIHNNRAAAEIPRGRHVLR